MLTELTENKDGIIKENQWIRAFKEENKDEFYQDIKEFSSYKDVFRPYNEWLESFTKEEKEKYIKIPEKNMNTRGVYVTSLNKETYLGRLTNEEAEDSIYLKNDFYFRSYGVCDNAEQAIEYADNLMWKNILETTDDYIILLVPMFKDSQPKFGGWRWHKWGIYIGEQNPEYEYLYDEKDIEMIYCFNIVK